MQNSQRKSALLNDTMKRGPKKFDKFSCRHLIMAEFYIIPVTSTWKAIFDTCVVIIIAYSIFSTLLIAAFNPTQEGAWYAFEVFVNCVFMIDFVLSKCTLILLLANSIDLDFFCEYQDPESFQLVNSHKLIAYRYLRSGWLFIDFAASFPFEFFGLLAQQTNVVNLLRLTRLSRLRALFDQSRVNRLLKSAFESSQREDRIEQ